MHAVSAVVTTGIYCRPGCWARPLAENVRSFPVAAAAEAAGFRACLQCRPYRMPLTAAWTGPETVCRAVRLILDGALDGGTEAELGRRLGVSARHLRRLFTTHLGVTPDGLARSARAHFARRLLDDTDLSITEIAFAAGYGSLRQFNRASQQVFRASPRELRAKRRKADRLVADGGLALRLAFNGPRDWEAMVSYFAVRAIPGVEQVCDGTYRRTIDVGTDPGVLELCRGGQDYLVLRLHLPHWEELIHLVERARRTACIDVDVATGGRVPGTWDPYETGVRAIIGQRTTDAAANATAARLVERFGVPVSGLRQIGLTHTFPTADILATADLAGIGLTRAKECAIGAFARAVAGDTIRLDGSVSLDRLVTSLTGVDGIEPWTAHYLALRMGEPDACPTSDLRSWPETASLRQSTALTVDP